MATSAHHEQLSAATRYDAFATLSTDVSWPANDQPRLNRGSKVWARLMIRSGDRVGPRRYHESCLHSASREHAISFLFHGGCHRRNHSDQGNAFPMAPSLLLDFRQ